MFHYNYWSFIFNCKKDYMLIDNFLDKHLVGKRVRLVEPMDDPHPILVGREGVVLSVGYDTIWVKWDNGRSLGLIIGLDVFEVIN